MKTIVTICRWLVGLLFIFSGMVKANDPLGLSFKMLEFFEKWDFHVFDNLSLEFAVAIIAVEVVAGVGIIIGWKPKFFSWLLLALILFFTFLTAYVLFSGKIHACGCFGDCIPLTPKQTFTKDLILLALILVVLFNINKIQPLFSNKISVLVLLIGFAFVSYVEYYVQQHLPIKDCLAYKSGNNILQQMQPQPGSTTDSFAIYYNYKKGDKIFKINALDLIAETNLPAGFDSTFQQVGDEEKVLVRKGTAEIKIPNFSLITLDGNDSTQAILNNGESYVMVFVKNFESMNSHQKVAAQDAIKKLQSSNKKVFIVTNDKVGAEQKLLGNVPTYICDATEIKTAARVNPTFIEMKGADIINKYAGIDASELLK